jgi:hypothetical protein
MHRVLATLFLLTGTLSAGCGSGADVSGKVSGEGFVAGAAWWGGPFIVLTEADYGCIDMSWVKPSYDDENPPGNEPKRFLQFHFNSGGEVAEGVFTIAETTESPVSADFFEYTGDALNHYRGRIGSLQVSEVSDSDKVSGDFDLSFDDGHLQGTLDKIKWCTNIKSGVATE